MARKKYVNRYFVMVNNNSPNFPTDWEEFKVASAFFANKIFSRDDFLKFTMMQVRIRPGYRSKGGSDYASLESGKRFKTLLNKGAIVEVIKK